MTLAALIAKLEAAPEGSDALDREIATVCGIEWSPDEDGQFGGYNILPRRCRFTSSLDAALTLVPEGWRVFELCEWAGIPPCGWHCVLDVRDLVTPQRVSAGLPADNDDRETKQIRTPALALCIAALKARDPTV